MLVFTANVLGSSSSDSFHVYRPEPRSQDTSQYIHGGLLSIAFILKTASEYVKTMITTYLSDKYDNERDLMYAFERIEQTAMTMDDQVKRFQPYLIDQKIAITDKQDINTVLALAMQFHSTIRLLLLKSTLLYSYHNHIYMDKHHPGQFFIVVHGKKNVANHSGLKQNHYQYNVQVIWNDLESIETKLSTWIHELNKQTS